MNSWPSKRLKYALERNDGGVWGDDPTGEGDTVVLRSTEQALDGTWRVEDPAKRSLPAGCAADTRLEVNDLLVTKTSGSARHIGKTSLVTKEVAALAPSFGNFMQRLRVNADADPRYIWRLLNMALVRDQFNLMATSSTGLANLTRDVIDRVRIPWWPLSTQQAIADYLDRETAKIDTLIGEQQRLIGLLWERRAAVAERAVADLDWRIPLRSLTTLIQTGPFGSQLKASEYVVGGTPVINPSHMVGGRVTPDKRIAVDPEKSESLSRHTLHEGDLVVARRGELGRCAVVRPDTAGALCGTGSAIIRPLIGLITSDFLSLVYGSRRNREVLALHSVGATMDNLNADILGALRVPAPSLNEQHHIVSSLTEEVLRIDQLVAAAERFIELSKERRSALITAAVTGQIDVREAA